ncbi:MAG: radical SAM protein, partial [Syntrophobacteraceae bacterium]
RYRMEADEVLACAGMAAAFGFGTVVLQGGEDYGLSTDWVAELIMKIKRETGLAVTLSLGERPGHELRAWREAGADRYLLRFETSDRHLYGRIHPSLPSRNSDRIELIRELGALGYETGSGVMVGIPGQTYQSLADDILLFRALDLDMIGIGPYIPNPLTPMGNGRWESGIRPRQQVPNSASMASKVVALARLLCPEANIPATTALATLDTISGYELG